MRFRAAGRWASPHLERLEERRLLTAVVGQQIFYNDSKFDGNDGAINAADDGAIAVDKTPFLSQVLFNAQQMTTNTDYDSNPRVYGDKIVWQGRGGTDAGTDDEIFYYDGATVHQLTENAVPDRFPQISALGISWERGTGTSQEIIYWNGTETPLTNNTVFDGNASLSDNRLSWEHDSGTALEIWSWDGVNPPADISNNSVVDVLPNTDGNNTVWVTGSVPNRKVLKFDGTTISTIGTSNLSIEDPKIDGADVAWESFKGTTSNDREIYFYNGTTAQQLTTNSFPDFDPQVSDGHVTWWGGVFNDFQIYLYDGNTIRAISTGIRNQYPQIDGQYVVWYGYDGHDNEIYLWDGIKVTQLTDNDLDDTNPQISGNHIVWQGQVAYNGTTQEIFHAYIDQPQASPANVTSYSRGINGIMIDLADLSAETVLTTSDFRFKVGSNNTPGTWTDAPAPAAISLRPGAGEGGSDRLEIVWADGAVTNTWLQVTVEGNDNAGGFNTHTGLPGSDIFYVGNRLGDTFEATPQNYFVTNAVDEISARIHLAFNQPITNLRDFDRNGLVNAGDQIIARTNGGFMIKLYLGSGPPAAGPVAAAPAAVTLNADPGMAFALAVTTKMPSRIEHSNAAQVQIRADNSIAPINRARQNIHGLEVTHAARRQQAAPTEYPAVGLVDELLDLLSGRH